MSDYRRPGCRCLQSYTSLVATQAGTAGDILFFLNNKVLLNLVSCCSLMLSFFPPRTIMGFPNICPTFPKEDN